MTAKKDSVYVTRLREAEQAFTEAQRRFEANPSDDDARAEYHETKVVLARARKIWRKKAVRRGTVAKTETIAASTAAPRAGKSTSKKKG